MTILSAGNINWTGWLIIPSFSFLAANVIK